MKFCLQDFWYASILCISIYLDDEGRTKKQTLKAFLDAAAKNEMEE